MLGNLEKDVGTSICAARSASRADERQQWVAMLDRGNYRYELGPGLPGVPELSGVSAQRSQKPSMRRPDGAFRLESKAFPASATSSSPCDTQRRLASDDRREAKSHAPRALAALCLDRPARASYVLHLVCRALRRSGPFSGSPMQPRRWIPARRRLGSMRQDRPKSPMRRQLSTLCRTGSHIISRSASRSWLRSPMIFRRRLRA